LTVETVSLPPKSPADRKKPQMTGILAEFLPELPHQRKNRLSADPRHA
jgi:hypothetical protein